MVALARGNVGVAVFNATLSSLLGMVLTPFLLGLVASSQPGIGHLSIFGSISDIVVKLLLPFLAGHLLRPWLGRWVAAHKPWITKLDRGVILAIIYAAFCQATIEGLWTRLDPVALLSLAAIVLGLLTVALWLTTHGARALGFATEDEIAAVFCGSKKSLATGAPIAGALFGSAGGAGAVLLPLMLYHQAQLLVCAVLARRYAARNEPVSSVGESYAG